MTTENSFSNPVSTRLGRIFAHWRGDLTGGLTAAVVALPLALAFAVASGVEPKAGLYTAIIAGIIAAVFGGSPVQITGPTGAMAVILVGIVSKYGIEKVWIWRNGRNYPNCAGSCQTRQIGQIHSLSSHSRLYEWHCGDYFLRSVKQLLGGAIASERAFSPWFMANIHSFSRF